MLRRRSVDRCGSAGSRMHSLRRHCDEARAGGAASACTSPDISMMQLPLGQELSQPLALTETHLQRNLLDRPDAPEMLDESPRPARVDSGGGDLGMERESRGITKAREKAAARQANQCANIEPPLISERERHQERHSLRQRRDKKLDQLSATYGGDLVSAPAAGGTCSCEDQPSVCRPVVVPASDWQPIRRMKESSGRSGNKGAREKKRRQERELERQRHGLTHGIKTLHLGETVEPHLEPNRAGYKSECSGVYDRAHSRQNHRTGSNFRPHQGGVRNGHGFHGVFSADSDGADGVAGLSGFSALTGSSQTSSMLDTPSWRSNGAALAGRADAEIGPSAVSAVSAVSAERTGQFSPLPFESSLAPDFLALFAQDDDGS